MHVARLTFIATVATTLLGISAAARPVAAEAAAPGPARARLILFITVDQLRGDAFDRVAGRLGDDGFVRLLDRGIHYTNAHYRHATTFTAVGHATLVTGGNPPEHGMAANEWFDRATGSAVYCVEDDRHVIHGAAPAPHRGTSPRNLTSSTIGDELIIATGGASRVFSVSVKDRGAILPGGHLGKAFWYSGGRFVTSTYYDEAPPAWLAAWNERRLADRWVGGAWTLLRARDAYASAADDDRDFERPPGGLGRVFPHPLPDRATSAYYRALPATPFGDELTVDLATEILESAHLGRGEATDMLAVSLSCTDYIGHAFGPYSLEAEDNLLRLDRTIARLLAEVDARVGLDRTIVVLSSDHGIDAVPEHRQAVFSARQTAGDDAEGRAEAGGADACCTGGRLDADRFIDRAEAALAEQLGVETKLILGFWSPGVYLDEPAIVAHGLKVAEVERCVAASLERFDGIALAVTRSDLLASRVPDSPVMRRVQRAFHPRRSGNVIVVQDPFWFLSGRPYAAAAMHGSPYPYDTHVPIVIAAPGGSARRVHRPVAPADIAPTLALLLGIESPSGCVGEPLGEVLEPGSDAGP